MFNFSTSSLSLHSMLGPCIQRQRYASACCAYRPTLIRCLSINPPPPPPPPPHTLLLLFLLLLHSRGDAYSQRLASDVNPIALPPASTCVCVCARGCAGVGVFACFKCKHAQDLCVCVCVCVCVHCVCVCSLCVCVCARARAYRTRPRERGMRSTGTQALDTR